MEPILNKFKSADELARAYAELETAFTKKCQELAALRAKTAGRDSAPAAQEPRAETAGNRCENTAVAQESVKETKGSAAALREQIPHTALFDVNKESALAQETAEATTAETESAPDENPRPTEASPTIAAAANLAPAESSIEEDAGEEMVAEGSSLIDADVSRFFEAYPAAKEDARALAELLARASVVDYTAILAAYATLLSSRVRAPEELAGDEEFLSRYIYPSERVRTYFTERNVPEPAPKLMRAGVGALTSPARPATLADAAELARRILK